MRTDLTFENFCVSCGAASSSFQPIKETIKAIEAIAFDAQELEIILKDCLTSLCQGGFQSDSSAQLKEYQAEIAFFKQELRKAHQKLCELGIIIPLRIPLNFALKVAAYLTQIEQWCETSIALDTQEQRQHLFDAEKALFTALAQRPGAIATWDLENGSSKQLPRYGYTFAAVHKVVLSLQKVTTGVSFSNQLTGRVVKVLEQAVAAHLTDRVKGLVKTDAKTLHGRIMPFLQHKQCGDVASQKLLKLHLAQLMLEWLFFSDEPSAPRLDRLLLLLERPENKELFFQRPDFFNDLLDLYRKESQALQLPSQEALELENIMSAFSDDPAEVNYSTVTTFIKNALAFQKFQNNSVLTASAGAATFRAWRQEIFEKMELYQIAYSLPLLLEDYPSTSTYPILPRLYTGLVHAIIGADLKATAYQNVREILKTGSDLAGQLTGGLQLLLEHFVTHFLPQDASISPFELELMEASLEKYLEEDDMEKEYDLLPFESWIYQASSWQLISEKMLAILKRRPQSQDSVWSKAMKAYSAFMSFHMTWDKNKGGTWEVLKNSIKEIDDVLGDVQQPQYKQVALAAMNKMLSLISKEYREELSLQNYLET